MHMVLICIHMEFLDLLLLNPVRLFLQNRKLADRIPDTLPADTSAGYNLCAFGIGDFASFCYKPYSDIAADAFISLKSQHCIQDKNITVASFIKEVISRQVQSAKFRQN